MISFPLGGEGALSNLSNHKRSDDIISCVTFDNLERVFKNNPKSLKNITFSIIKKSFPSQVALIIITGHMIGFGQLQARI